MFTRQAPIIANNLWQGGVSQPQASAVTNALGQCNTPLLHRAPVTVDTTTPDMTLITPETTIFRFPTAPMLPPEPKPPIQDLPDIPLEELPEFEPEPFDIEPYPVVNTYYTIRTVYPTETRQLLAKAGKYLRVPRARVPTVELKYKDDKDDTICTFQLGHIKGITDEELMERLDEKLREWFEEEVEEPGTGETTSVVTGITLDGDTLSVSTASIRVYEVNPGDNDDIDVIECG